MILRAHSRRDRRASAPVVFLSALSLLTACGGGGGGGGGAGVSSDLEGALNTLGVDTTKTPRQTAPGLTMESSTSPLGNKPKLALTNELVMCNIGLAGAVNNNAPMLLAEVTDNNGNATVDVLHGQDASQIPFLPHLGNQFEFPQATSAVVAADTDGNGLDEIVFVYQNGIETRVRSYGDATNGFAQTDVQLAANGNVTDVAAVATDFDLDGKDDLVIGLTVAGAAKVTMWRFDGAAYSRVGGELEVLPDLPPSQMSLQLAAGNIDQDAGPEIVVGIQERNANTGSARVVVLDDIKAGFNTLRSEPFAERDQNQTLRNGFSCSVAMGDIDGDGLDEIVVGGVTEFTTQCNTPLMLMVAYDDKEHAFAKLGGTGFSFQRSLSGCGSPANRYIRTVHVNTLDIDNDGVDEISANVDVFDDFLNTTPWTSVQDWRLPDVAMTQSSSNSSLFDRNTSSFVVGDFTGDDYEDIATYYQTPAGSTSQVERVRIYGLTQLSSQIQELRSIQCVNNNPVQGAAYPMLLPANVDLDSPVLSYSEAEYKLVFSEPVVLAALAAPPTQSGIGQNVGGSYTAFGNTTSTTSERERSVTFSASVSAGVNLDGGPITQSEFELKDTLTVAGSRTKGRAYELSKTILFTSAPTEDLVVFTSVPIDRYTYTILSHPDPTLIGQKVMLNYPREPVTMQAERAFYNNAVPANAVHVDGSVFKHTIGDVTSYPTTAEKNALLGLNNGLQVGPIGVGQGGGTTEVTLQVGTSISTGGSLAVSYEREMEVTAGGALGGVSVGVGTESTWRITSGQSTTYTGVVGAIEATNFAANRYSYGLFTYVHRDPATRQQYQVLNYWVVK
ncbi:MAG: VCBS repeat-containing protein [Planctomycetes bacterium]|nr:VCBS repeat-containing protein [Planctomycetota bacterium]MCB9887583.1 VCBS repeat-containing protein [Planctomycetota bacterium]